MVAENQTGYSKCGEYRTDPPSRRAGYRLVGVSGHLGPLSAVHAEVYISQAGLRIRKQRLQAVLSLILPL